MATPSTVPEKRELHVTEIFINEDVTLVYMPDVTLCDLHVKGNKRYVVHFLKPDVFGQEFATIWPGNNLFTIKMKNETTDSYFFDDAQLRSVVKRAEGQEPAQMMPLAALPTGMAAPCTGPIIIPPRPL
jgi:hypothetical protein